MTEAIRRDGVTIRTGVRAQRAQAGAGTDGAHVIELDDGSTAEGHEILLAVGRELGLEDLGLEHYGLDPSRRDGVPHDGRLRVADGLWMVGDAAGPELHTHQGHYQGELAVRMALGEAIEPDYRALPAGDVHGSRGRLGRADARPGARGRLRCVRARRRLREDRQGLLRGGRIRARHDRGRPRLRASWSAPRMAVPDASAAIHECVLAIKARVPIGTLAETIHAFPSTSRIFNGLFADARRELERPGSVVKG